MKYIILLGDGMPDYPLKDLGDRTPLEAAYTPNMDLIAKNGSVGSVKTVADGFTPGSDVTNLAIMGYNPDKYYTGRAPLEAASLGVKLDADDVAFRCNLVTLKPSVNSVFMEDFSAGHISTEDARELILYLNNEIGSDEFIFYPGISYRHLMVWKRGKPDFKLTPPHDISGKDIKEYLPKGHGADKLVSIMNNSQLALANHQINKKKKNGDKEANSIWLWGHGKMPTLPLFTEQHRLNGSLIAAVDLIKGIGICAGLNVVDVPGATGYLDTNFKGKADYALRELEKNDFVYLHVEAPDEAGHNGSFKEKIKAIEDFDSMVVGNILEGIKKFNSYRILLVSDHSTPVSIKTHSAEAVPFAIFPAIKGIKGDPTGFSEKKLNMFEVKIDKGYELIKLLFSEKTWA